MRGNKQYYSKSTDNSRGGKKGKAEIEPRMNHLLWIQVRCGLVKFIEE